MLCLCWCPKGEEIILNIAIKFSSTPSNPYIKNKHMEIEHSQSTQSLRDTEVENNWRVGLDSHSQSVRSELPIDKS